MSVRLALACIIVLVVVLVAVKAILTRRDQFVGAGMSLGANSAASYNSGASMRDLSVAQDLYGEYLTKWEDNEGRFTNARNSLARWDWKTGKVKSN